jgi:hypothetical protein
MAAIEPWVLIFGASAEHTGNKIQWQSRGEFSLSTDKFRQQGSDAVMSYQQSKSKVALISISHLD